MQATLKKTSASGRSSRTGWSAARVPSKSSRPVGVPHVVHRLAHREGDTTRPASRRSRGSSCPPPWRSRSAAPQVADEDHRSSGRVDGITVHVERGLPGQHQVELLLTGRADPVLAVLADYVPVAQGQAGAHPESLDAEVAADVRGTRPSCSGPGSMSSSATTSYAFAIAVAMHVLLSGTARAAPRARSPATSWSVRPSAASRSPFLSIFSTSNYLTWRV